MRAVIQPGKKSSDLIVGTVPIPQPNEREVQIKVKFSAINRMDLYQATGVPPPPGLMCCLSCVIYLWGDILLTIDV